MNKIRTITTLLSQQQQSTTRSFTTTSSIFSSSSSPSTSSLSPSSPSTTTTTQKSNVHKEQSNLKPKSLPKELERSGKTLNSIESAIEKTKFFVLENFGDDSPPVTTSTSGMRGGSAGGNRVSGVSGGRGGVIGFKEKVKQDLKESKTNKGSEELKKKFKGLDQVDLVLNNNKNDHFHHRFTMKGTKMPLRNVRTLPTASNSLPSTSSSSSSSTTTRSPRQPSLQSKGSNRTNNNTNKRSLPNNKKQERKSTPEFKLNEELPPPFVAKELDLAQLIKSDLLSRSISLKHSRSVLLSPSSSSSSGVGGGIGQAERLQISREMLGDYSRFWLDDTTTSTSDKVGGGSGIATLGRARRTLNLNPSVGLNQKKVLLETVEKALGGGNKSSSSSEVRK